SWNRSKRAGTSLRRVRSPEAPKITSATGGACRGRVGACNSPLPFTEAEAMSAMCLLPVCQPLSGGDGTPAHISAPVLIFVLLAHQGSLAGSCALCVLVKGRAPLTCHKGHAPSACDVRSQRLCAA